MESRKVSLRIDEFEAFDEPEDVYDTSSKQQLSDQLRIWESENVHSNPKNAEAYEIEKRDVIVIVNNFVTKLYIESQRFKNNDNNMTNEKYEEMEGYLTDQVVIAHDLITRLKQLLTMERTDAMMDRSLNRTRFFKTGDDQKTQDEEKESSRQKALLEKRQKVNFLNESVDSITDRYNRIIETINVPGDYKFLDEFKTSTILLELKKNLTKEKKDTKGNTSNKEDSPMLGSPLEILNSRIIDPEVKPTYHNIGTDLLVYVLVEGKGSKKEKAKEDAATEMIRLILNKQNAKTLPNQFKPFDEHEINELQALLKTKQNYTDFLEETNNEIIDVKNPIK